MSNRSTERRQNPLSGEWVLVSQGRNNRPWTGQVEHPSGGESEIEFDPNCALCPGVVRSSGQANPSYSGVYVFDNDFPALAAAAGRSHSSGSLARQDHELFITQQESGKCRVVCFSDNHSVTIARMSTEEIVPVIECFIDQTDDLLSIDGINHVQIFENRGETMGCSNPHPHGQIWAQKNLPTLPAREARAMADYHAAHRETLLGNYLSEELTRGERVVCENESFAVVVPYWAAWPFETLLIPKRAVSLLTELNADEVEAFADIVRRISVRYDNLFKTNFPYSSGIHQSSTNTEAFKSFHLHMHYFPPLLRSASVRKFMVGYELMAEAQRDLSPEEAASHLRNQPEIHYMNSGPSEASETISGGATLNPRAELS